MLVEVRCCCDPGKLLGFVPLPDFVEPQAGASFVFPLDVPGWDLLFEDGNRARMSKREVDEIRLELAIWSAPPELPGERVRGGVAFKSGNTPLETLKRIVGWVPVLLLLALLCSSSSASAQNLDHAARNALRWDNPHAADVLSNITVAAALTVPCLADRTWSCLRHEGMRVGAAAGLAELAKLLVHRERPDGSENVSFYSMHTSITCAATLRTAAWEFCPAVAYERIAADKHWLSDTAAGAGVAFVIVRVW